jgi:hypothetical protein
MVDSNLFEMVSILKEAGCDALPAFISIVLLYFVNNLNKSLKTLNSKLKRVIEEFGKNSN